jgi:hypothetical protein
LERLSQENGTATAVGHLRINSLRVQLQHAAPGAHEKSVEIQIKYLRNRFEVVKASLPFNLSSGPIVVVKL